MRDEMQKLTERIGDNIAGLDGPLGEKTCFPELSHLHRLPVGILGNLVFSCCSEEVFKAPPAAMDVCLMKKNTMPS